MRTVSFILLLTVAPLLSAFSVPAGTPTAAVMLGEDEVRLKYFRVDEQGSEFLLTWETDVEQELRAFEVQRKTAFSGGQFVVVKEYEPHGTARQYLFTDDQVFKSADTQDIVDYRLVAVYQSGAREILASKSVNYTSTALRRTWGSIKAMF